MRLIVANGGVSVFEFFWEQHLSVINLLININGALLL